MQVDISLPAIRWFLYGESADATRTPHTTKFDYSWQIVKDGQFLREQALRETTKRWMALHLSVDEDGTDWVTEPKGAIKQANLTFVAKFLWLLVRHCLSPTAADNIVTWDRAVLMAAMMASPGSHARVVIQGHYYLPLPVYDFCSLQDRRCAHMVHRSVEDPVGHR